MGKSRGSSTKAIRNAERNAAKQKALEEDAFLSEKRKAKEKEKTRDVKQHVSVEDIDRIQLRNDITQIASLRTADELQRFIEMITRQAALINIESDAFAQITKNQNESEQNKIADEQKKENLKENEKKAELLDWIIIIINESTMENLIQFIEFLKVQDKERELELELKKILFDHAQEARRMELNANLAVIKQAEKNMQVALSVLPTKEDLSNDTFDFSFHLKVTQDRIEYLTRAEQTLDNLINEVQEQKVHVRNQWSDCQRDVSDLFNPDPEEPLFELFNPNKEEAQRNYEKALEIYHAAQENKTKALGLVGALDELEKRDRPPSDKTNEDRAIDILNEMKDAVTDIVESGISRMERLAKFMIAGMGEEALQAAEEDKDGKKRLKSHEQLTEEREAREKAFVAYEEEKLKDKERFEKEQKTYAEALKDYHVNGDPDLPPPLPPDMAAPDVNWADPDYLKYIADARAQNAQEALADPLEARSNLLDQIRAFSKQALKPVKSSDQQPEQQSAPDKAACKDIIDIDRLKACDNAGFCFATPAMQNEKKKARVDMLGLQAREQFFEDEKKQVAAEKHVLEIKADVMIKLHDNHELSIEAQAAAAPASIENDESTLDDAIDFSKIKLNWSDNNDEQNDQPAPPVPPPLSEYSSDDVTPASKPKQAAEENDDKEVYLIRNPNNNDDDEEVQLRRNTRLSEAKEKIQKAKEKTREQEEDTPDASHKPTQTRVQK